MVVTALCMMKVNMAYRLKSALKAHEKVSKLSNAGFRARKALQKFKYSVLGHMGELFFEHWHSP